MAMHNLLFNYCCIFIKSCSSLEAVTIEPELIISHKNQTRSSITTNSIVRVTVFSFCIVVSNFNIFLLQIAPRIMSGINGQNMVLLKTEST